MNLKSAFLQADIPIKVKLHIWIFPNSIKIGSILGGSAVVTNEV